MTEAQLDEFTYRQARGQTGPSDTATLLVEVRRLREALLDYGEHGFGPDHRPCPKELVAFYTECTCGLDAALAGGPPVG